MKLHLRLPACIAAAAMRRNGPRTALLCVLAAVGGAVAMLLGFWFTREAPVGTVRDLGPGTTAAVADSAFLVDVERFAAARWEHGAAELLFDGDGTFPRLWNDLRAARHSITFHVFWMQPGAPADTLARILAERARAGVRVLLLYDAYGSGLPDSYFDALRAADVAVAELRPLSALHLSKAQHRSHMRAVVIDGVIGYTGGFAIDPHWLGSGRREGEWRETSLRVQGALARQLQTVFLATWAEAAGSLLTGEPFFTGAAQRTDGPGVVQAAVVYSPATIGSTNAERLVALTIAGARRRLYLTSAYFAPGDDLLALLAAAARRGVDVRILTASEHTDQPLARRAGRGTYEPLLRAGVRIYEYAPTMVHAKTIVADGAWSVVGTINLDNRSLALNDEVAVVTPDSAIAAALERAFAGDLRLAREIRLDEFAERGWWQRLRERAASLALRLL